MASEVNYDQVICPNCVHQFGAIPVNVQQKITALEQSLEDAVKRADRLEQFKNFFEAIASTVPHMNDYKSTEAVTVEALLDWVKKAKDAEKERDDLKARCAKLCELIQTAHREVGNGFDMLASATWDHIVETAKGKHDDK